LITFGKEVGIEEWGATQLAPSAWKDRSPNPTIAATMRALAAFKIIPVSLCLGGLRSHLSV